MQWYEQLDEKIRDYLPDMTVERDVPMSRHTSFRIGGPARRMAFPESREQLVILLGLWFIRGPKDKTPIDDEIPPFAPPASSAAGACAADPAEARAEDVASDRSAAGNAPEGEEAHRDEQP